MEKSFKIFILVCFLVSAWSFAIAQSLGAGGSTVSSFNSITREEIELLLVDVAVANPEVIRKLAADPEMRRSQIENLRQLLAFASQAQKDGLADEPVNRQKLENIRSEVVAVNYDKEINKDKGPMPPFGFITEAQVIKFWSTGGSDHKAEFQKFLDTKVILLKRSDPQMKDREVTDEEKTQARDFYAKTKIYEKEFDEKVASSLLTEQFKKKVDLQVKFQQAQFLARTYSEKVADKTKVSDEEIAKFIAGHPELDTTGKKAKAEDILNRAKAGGNFAALANKLSEDPGNKGLNGKLQGGIYVNVPKGRMVSEFENAALALEPGQVAPNLVETDFGYHIIKLEKKGPAGPTQTYDVRHILISTSYKDPVDPGGRDMPVKEYVRNRLETDREKQLLDKIVADNNIQVPEDFTVPDIAEAPPQKITKKRLLKKKRPAKKRR